MSKTIEDLHWIFGKEKFESFSPETKAKAIILYNNDNSGDWDELLKLRYEEPENIWPNRFEQTVYRPDEFKKFYLGDWNTLIDKED